MRRCIAALSSNSIGLTAQEIVEESKHYPCYASTPLLDNERLYVQVSHGIHTDEPHPFMCLSRKSITVFQDGV